MTRKDELLVALRRVAQGGTPSELAAALNVERYDKTFRRALEEAVSEGTLIAEGSTKDRRYRRGARRIASGFGAALDLELVGPKGSEASFERAEAFAKMSARIGHKTIGARG